MIPLNVALSAGIFFNTAFSLILSLYSWRHRAVEVTALPFCVLLFFAAIYMGFYGCEILSADLAHIYLFLRLEYIGIAFIPACFIWLAVSFRLKSACDLSFLVPVAVIISTVNLIVFATNDFHHLYYSTLVLDSSGPFPVARAGHGPWYVFNSAYYVCCMVFAIAVYLARIRSTGGLDRSRMLFVTGAFSIALIGEVAAALGFVPWELDVMPVILFFVNLIMAYAVVRKNFFDVSALARKLVFDAMDEGVLVILPNKEIVDWNPAVFDYFPEAERKLYGKKLGAISPELMSICENMEYGSKEELLLSVGLKARNVSVDMIRVSSSGADRAGTALILRDITEAKERLYLLEELATRDGLTGIFNRRHWIDLAEREFARTKRAGRALSLLMIDIDHFKDFNDTWGHAMGDTVLRTVTDTISAMLRSSDIFGRVGGEEFAILLPETDAELATRIAERLRIAVESATLSGSVPISISQGLSSISAEDQTLYSLMRRSDRALYRAKDNGRNRVEIIEIEEAQ
jgi:diguanylate cyclase (GGDEF)-like protein